MKVLVTGSSGFIGAKLVAELNRLGYVVDGIDTVPSKYTNIVGNAASTTSDLRNYALVYHLACLRMADCEVFEVEAYNSNLSTVINVHSKNETAIHVLASTSSIYRSGLGLLETDTVRPTTIYGLSKFAAEEFLRARALNYRTLRFGNVYGPGHSPYHSSPGVIAKFINNALSGEKLVLYDSSGVRDFVYVDDIVDGLIDCVDWAPNQVYNTGTGVPTPISSLAEKIIKLTNSKSQIVLGDRRSIDKQTYKTLSTYNPMWNAKTLLEDGLKYTIEWQKRNLR